MTAPSRIELLELDIDCRLAALWQETADISEWNLETAATFMRAAYGIGFCAAFSESDPERLFRDHGYCVPERRPA